MADFCRQCSAMMGFPEPGDLNGITTLEAWTNGTAALVICEGCGGIQVDPDGYCVSKNCIENHEAVTKNREDVRRFWELGK